MSEKYKVSRTSIAKRIKEENWQRQSAEIEQKVSENIKNSLIEQKTEVNKKHIQLITDSLDVVQELLNVYKKELQQGKFKKANAKNMDYLMSAIIKAQKGQRLALNIDDSDQGALDPEINVIKGLDIRKI